MDLVEPVDLVLRTTRSVRRRIDFERPLEPALIEACIASAVQAPTGLLREAWRFVVLTEPAPKRAVAALYREAFHELRTQRLEALRRAGESFREPGSSYQELADRLEHFPALILVCSLGRPAAHDLAQQLAFYGSVLPAAWSLMLALRARGIGATWTTLLSARERQTAAALGIPDDVTPTVLLPAGWLRDAVLRPAARRAPHEVTYWNAWGRERGDG